MERKRGSVIRQLRRLIIQHFSLEELKVLAYDLGVNWDELGGDNITAKSHALILHLDRRGRLGDLIRLLREERSHVAWPEAPPAAPIEYDIATEVREEPAVEEVTIVRKVAKLLKPHDKDGHVTVTTRHLIHNSLLGREVVKFPLMAIDDMKVTRTTLIPALRLKCSGQEYTFTFFTMAQARAVADAIKQARDAGS